MKTESLLEEECTKLKNELTRNLRKKQVLELEISKEFEHLKSLEIAMEKSINVSMAEKGRPLV